VGHWLVDDNTLTQIRAVVYGGSGYSAQPLVMQWTNPQNGREVSRISPSLWMLPPRPLAQTVPGQSGVSMSLLTLVDDRYWWWNRSGQLTVNEGTTTWAQLYAEVGTILGVTINVDTVPNSYLKPSAQLAENNFVYMPPTLDAIAYYCGQRITRGLDGTVRARNPVNAAADVSTNRLFPVALSLIGGIPSSAVPFRQAGGDFLFDTTKPINDLAGVLPNTVAVSFPQVNLINGIPQPSGQYLESSVTLSALALSDFPPATQTNPNTKQFHDLTPAVYESDTQTLATTGSPSSGTFTLTFNAQTTSAIAYNAFAHDIQVALQALSSIGAGNMICTGGPLGTSPVVCTFTGALANNMQPTMTHSDSFNQGSLTIVHTFGGGIQNLTELQNLTKQVATDWYRFQVAGMDWKYAGIIPWQPDALHDCVEWAYTAEGGPSGAGDCFTRVQRPPLDDLMSELEHGGGFTDSVEACCGGSVINNQFYTNIIWNFLYFVNFYQVVNFYYSFTWNIFYYTFNFGGGGGGPLPVSTPKVALTGYGDGSSIVPGFSGPGGTAPLDGQILVVENVGNVKFQLSNNDAGVDPAFRIFTELGVNYTVWPFAGIMLEYQAALPGWVFMNPTFGTKKGSTYQYATNLLKSTENCGITFLLNGDGSTTINANGRTENVLVVQGGSFDPSTCVLTLNGATLNFQCGVYQGTTIL